MKLLDLTLSSPEENLACDEALLELAESSEDQEYLRFWESPCHFAVLGYSNKLAEELNVAACRRDGIQILRRPSGGGTVLQGPGCFNYTLVLRIDGHDSLKNLIKTNAFILEKHREMLLPHLGKNVAVQGISDLTLENLKFSGNAQRRRKKCLLFHGTFLYDFDLALIPKYLKHPPRQPDYRQGRPHGSFITNISLTGKKLREILQTTWKVTGKVLTHPPSAIKKLVEEKYSLSSWNQKF